MIHSFYGSHWLVASLPIFLPIIRAAKRCRRLGLDNFDNFALNHKVAQLTTEERRQRARQAILEAFAERPMRLDQQTAQGTALMMVVPNVSCGHFRGTNDASASMCAWRRL
jgi:hypothetical protein